MLVFLTVKREKETTRKKGERKEGRRGREGGRGEESPN